MKNNILGTNNHSVEMMIIWFLIFISLVSILILGVVLQIIFKKIRFKFDVKLISILSMYLAFYIVIGFLSNMFGEIHIVFDYIVPITVGFMYTPIIGVFFGFVGYFIKSVLFGDMIWILPSLLAPIMGLLGGYGRFVWDNDKISKKGFNYIFWVLIISLTLILSIIFIPTYLINENFDKVGLFISFTYINIFIIVVTYVIFISRKEEDKDVSLFIIILLITSIVRVFDLIITPFNGYFIGKYENYWISLMDYTFRSGYMIIIQGLGAYTMIKTSIEANKIINEK